MYVFRFAAPAIAGALLAASASAAALGLTVEAKERAVVGEPVEVVIRVRNDSEKPHPDFFLDHGYDFGISIAREGGEPVRFMAREVVEAITSSRERVRREPGPLDPGEVRETRVLLSWDVQKKDFALARPGRHTVEVRTEVAGSASVAIEVLEPRGAGAEALEAIRAPDLGPFISEEAGDRLERDDPRITKLEALAARFGETAYGPGIRRALRRFGRGRVLDAYPASAGLGKCPVGETREYLIMIRSSGSEPVRIEMVDGPEAPFEWGSEPPPTPLLLSPPRNREFLIRFRPSAKGRFRGAIVFHSDDSGGRPVRMDLLGEGE